MELSKIEFIINFFEDYDMEDNYFGDNVFNIKLHALFSCLTEKELKFLFSSQLSLCSNFSIAVLNFIVKKVAAKQLNINTIIIDIIEKYPSYTYKEQLYYRTIISTVAVHLDGELLIKYFTLFIDSERVNDRKKAFEIAGRIWKDVEEEVWKSYLKRKDPNALIQIINYSTSEDLISNLSVIWERDTTRNYHKKLILEKTSESHISHFDFLKTTEPTFYFQALRLRNLPIDTRFLKSLVNELLMKNNRFVFYYIGIAKNWSLLIETIETTKSVTFEK